jgi:NTE family protein
MSEARMPRVGLALGGGVGHGLAHIGVLSVLGREGIPIDCVAGTSAGALVGAFCAAGWSGEQMTALAGEFRWGRLARLAGPGRGGLISFYKLERFVADQLGDPRFEDLRRPFIAMASDLATGEPVPLRAGRVAPAVHASCAVPGFIVPANVDGRLLSDGGVCDNVPTSAARGLGAEYVIAVCIFGQHWRSARFFLMRGVAAVESAVRWAGGGMRTADCLIEPDIAHLSYTHARDWPELLARGEAAAEAKLPEIKAALGL